MDTNLLQDEEERQVVGTRCLSKAGLAEGTNANTIKIVTPNGAGIDYAIGDKLYHKADADNIAMTACAQQAANTQCIYLVSLDTSGNVTITKGTEIAAAGTLAVSDIPLVPSGQCVFGAIKVVLGATTFTSGTTDLSAANVTATYADLSRRPVSVPL